MVISSQFRDDYQQKNCNVFNADSFSTVDTNRLLLLIFQNNKLINKLFEFSVFIRFYLFVIKLFLQTTDDNSQEVKMPNKEIRRES